MSLTLTKVTLDQTLIERLEKLAKSRFTTTEALMITAIKEMLDREDARPEFDRITLERWAEFEATGKYISHERVDAWLARLEAGEDVEPPEPECD
jgi:predicted transcriptional regulator